MEYTNGNTFVVSECYRVDDFAKLFTDCIFGKGVYTWGNGDTFEGSWWIHDDKE